MTTPEIESEMIERFHLTYPGRKLTKMERYSVRLITEMALPRILAGERYNWNPGQTISLTFHTADEKKN